jgi:hypothetical protein
MPIRLQVGAAVSRFSTLREEKDIKNSIYGPTSPLFLDLGHTASWVSDELRPLHEAWAGVGLESSGAYGVRLYRENASMVMHVDKVCVYVCMYVFMYVCIYVCMCVCMYVCVYVCMYVCVCVYVCMCVCMCVCMYVCVYVCMYMYRENASMVMHVDKVGTGEQGNMVYSHLYLSPLPLFPNPISPPLFPCSPVP